MYEYDGEYSCYIYRKGTEKSQFLCNGGLRVPVNGESGKISIVESGGKLFVCTYREFFQAAIREMSSDVGVLPPNRMEITPIGAESMVSRVSARILRPFVIR